MDSYGGLVKQLDKAYQSTLVAISKVLILALGSLQAS